MHNDSKKQRSESESYGDFAYRTLRDKIMKLELIPGETLNEFELAEELKISRMPVHEAIRRLKDENLVEVEARKGSRVTYINLVRVNDGIFIRNCVEPELIQVTRGNISAPIMQHMIQLLNRQKDILLNGDPRDEYNALDDAFHRALYFAANRQNTYEQICKMVTHFDRVRWLGRRNCNFAQIDEASYLEHKEILAAVAYRTPLSVPAHELMNRHLTRFYVFLDGLMEKYPHYFVTDQTDLTF